MRGSSRPFLDRPHELLADVMAPLRVPDHPLLMLRFGLRALFPASWLARLWFRGERARALFAGCAAHAVLPLSQPFTAALGLLFAITAHVEDWPVAQGGSRAIAARARVVFAQPGRTDRDEPPDHAPRRAAPRARRAIRYLARSARADRGRGAARGLPPPPRALPLRPRRLQARLGARRTDSVAGILRAARRRPFTSAARSRRSARRSATCTTAVTPNARS